MYTSAIEENYVFATYTINNREVISLYELATSEAPEGLALVFSSSGWNVLDHSKIGEIKFINPLEATTILCPLAAIRNDDLHIIITVFNEQRDLIFIWLRPFGSSSSIIVTSSDMEYSTQISNLSVDAAIYDVEVNRRYSAEVFDTLYKNKEVTDLIDGIKEALLNNTQGRRRLTVKEIKNIVMDYLTNVYVRRHDING